jgi:hypothetical protein
MRTIFDLCEPRGDILKGDVGKADFGADLASARLGVHLTGAIDAEWWRKDRRGDGRGKVMATSSAHVRAAV